MPVKAANEESHPILSSNSRSYVYESTHRSSNELDAAATTDNSSRSSPLTYPKAIAFILFSKLFESFAANGVRTVLALYLRDSLNYSEGFSTSVLHIFNFFGQFCPILGAIIADGYIGNAKTIFYFLFFYAAGWIGMIVITFPFSGLPFVPLLFSSLILIAIGNGSIRACITSLGGNQFQLPEQVNSLNNYFSHYYFMYYMGILLSKLVPPAIRAHTQCFGKDDCYMAVFGALGLVFLMCWLVFLCGMFFYKPEQPNIDGNILCQVCGCIWFGLFNKLKGSPIKVSHWIYGSIGRYPESFVRDVADYLRLLSLYIPLPIYWALLAQQDSTWTFQATQLNTNILGINIEADQAKAMGPIILLIMIPVWQNSFLPFMRKIGYDIPLLLSVAIGGICASLAFVCAGLLQVNIEQNLLEIDSTEAINNTIVSSAKDAIVTASSISVLWQVPQFFLLMMGEILLSIPGLQFSFTEAPASMKSVLTASWFSNNAIGNLIVVFITELHLVEEPSNQFFLYAVLMCIGVLTYSVIAYNFKYSYTEVLFLESSRHYQTQSDAQRTV